VLSWVCKDEQCVDQHLRKRSIQRGIEVGREKTDRKGNGINRTTGREWRRQNRSSAF
jgi:cell division GTPase FtsZ